MNDSPVSPRPPQSSQASMSPRNLSLFCRQSTTTWAVFRQSTQGKSSPSIKAARKPLCRDYMLQEKLLVSLFTGQIVSVQIPFLILSFSAVPVPTTLKTPSNLENRINPSRRILEPRQLRIWINFAKQTDQNQPPKSVSTCKKSCKRTPSSTPNYQ